MPRNASGVYSPPPGTEAVANTTIASAPYNNLVADIAAEMNSARPITAGGTGATTPSAARVALGIAEAFVSYDAGQTLDDAEKQRAQENVGLSKGWKHVATYAITTGVAAIDIPLPSDFDLFQVDLVTVKASTDVPIRGRLSLDGTTFAASGYISGAINNTASSVEGGSAADTQFSILAGTPVYSASGPIAAASLWVDPGSADTAAHIRAMSSVFVSGSVVRAGLIATYFGVLGRVASIRLFVASGTITKGKFVLTGLKL